MPAVAWIETRQQTSVYCHRRNPHRRTTTHFIRLIRDPNLMTSFYESYYLECLTDLHKLYAHKSSSSRTSASAKCRAYKHVIEVPDLTLILIDTGPRHKYEDIAPLHPLFCISKTRFDQGPQDSTLRRPIQSKVKP